jgi:NAD(P)H-dependent FMN reductase
MTRIAVIVGSTRKGRVTDKLAKWAATEVAKIAEVDTLDLRDYPLPFIDEQISPRYNPNRTVSPEVQKWLDAIAGYDGYMVVTPEYNRAMPGVLKNGLDLLDHQMDNKPVALVAHGTAGGGQAVGNLRMALPGVGAVTLPQALYFKDGVGEAIDEAGVLKEALADNPYGPQAGLAELAATLVKYAEALRAVQ